MAAEDVALKLQKAAAAYVAQSRSDLNIEVPAIDTDGTGRKRHVTGSATLKRLLGSPLARNGKYAKGPNKERVISSGWGRPRIRHSKRGNERVGHKGMDYRSVIGEEVYASADGRVTFAGLSTLAEGGINVPGVYADSNTREVFNGDGQLIAVDRQIGDAGIYISITHTGDFDGFVTEYMHLQKVLVRKGDRVTEGQLIGLVGNTAVRRGSVHLHYQVKFNKVVVNAAGLVPNYWPGRIDSTNTASLLGLQDLGEKRPAGQNVVVQNAAGTVQAVDRDTNMQNQRGGDHKRMQSAHRERVARNLNAQQSQLYSAIAQFGGNAPVITGPMTFDFTTGLWSDGKAV